MFTSKIGLYFSLALVALFAFTISTDEEVQFEKRQIGNLVSGIIDPSTTTPISSSKVSSTPSSTPASSTVSSTPTSSSPISSTPSSTPASSTPSQSSTTTDSPTIDSSTPSQTPDSSSTSETPIVTRTPRSTVVVTITSNGQTITSASTDFTSSTLNPSGTTLPDSSSNNNGDTGISPQTKSTIIGVTVGIGGAIILGGLAFVAWRLWGKKHDAADEDEILMAGSSAHGEKLTDGNSPFKSTLDQYHANPGTNF